MSKSLGRRYRNTSLATRIRFSYLLIILPIIALMGVGLYTLNMQNKRYDELIEAVDLASQFSLDFKKDFDYETYLVIVESKTFEESKLREMLNDASSVVDNLGESANISKDNRSMLDDIRKYLRNLGTYTDRIEANLAEGEKYEENMEIWENDVQIVTYLVRETILQFIYYELQDLRQSRAEMNAFYTRLFSYGALAAAIVTLLVIILSYVISQSITKPVRELSKVTEKVARGDLSVRAELDTGAEIGVLSTTLNDMIDRINALLNQVRTEQESLRTAELELLQSQINPHFLYNTLDTIVWLAEAGDMSKVVDMVGSLSDFFRTSLGQGRDVVTIEDELKHVISYLKIQQVRYQDILEYSVDVPHEIYTSSIPKITLQPLVENALYHGIKNKRGKGRITVTGKVESGCIYLYVEDNGIGMTEERLKELSDKLGTTKSFATLDSATPSVANTSDKDAMFGLSNVDERIRLKFGSRYGIHIDSVYGEGTTVTLLLPV
ncbi:MAG: sensor histidine kinase [Lachnospiraceae bacterium]|nr:sensor histidine kinase [Lachnospiraceae bacterium]